MPKGGHNKKGLRVGYTDGLVKPDIKCHHKREFQPDGLYIYCWVNVGDKTTRGWRPICGLRFARVQDAQRGADCLARAGLDTYAKLKDAKYEDVREIVYGDLQW